MSRSIKKKRPFSPTKVVVLTIFIAALVVVSVRKEIEVDETVRKIREIEIELMEKLVMISEAQAELERLTSSSSISAVAANQGLEPIASGQKIINVYESGLPPEFSRQFEPLIRDSIGNPYPERAGTNN